jgi:hypothetical protein
LRYFTARWYFSAFFKAVLSGKNMDGADVRAAEVTSAIFDKFGIDKEQKLSKQQFIDGYS